MERRYEIVKQLLEKLPESQRTVVTLYYLGEMTTKEIGNFLGVSVNTVKSRLRRARMRLQKEEQLLISEILGSFRLPVNLTESIMRQVVDMKPGPAPSVVPSLKMNAVPLGFQLWKSMTRKLITGRESQICQRLAPMPEQRLLMERSMSLEDTVG